MDQLDPSRIPSVVHAPPVRALGKWMLMWLVPREEKVGSIIIPQGTYTKAEDFAVVVSVGRGIPTRKKIVPHGVVEGDVVIVVRIHEITATQKAVQAELGQGFVFLQENDIEGVVEDVPKVQIVKDALLPGDVEESAA